MRSVPGRTGRWMRCIYAAPTRLAGEKALDDFSR